MKPSPALRRLFAHGGLPLLWIALTALNLLPVWNQRLLPMLDTPNHLALIRGWFSYHDPAYHISQYYTLRLRAVPYLFFYSFVHLFMHFVSIEVANKLFLSLYLILFPLSVLCVARALGRDPWLALGAFPLSFNPAWIYGYSSLLIGNTFAFFALAALIRYLRSGERRLLAVLFFASLLAYFSHVLPWVVFGLLAAMLLWVYRAEGRRVVRAAWVMLPSVAFAVAAVIDEHREHAYLRGDKPLKFSWFDFPTLVMELPRRILEIFPGPIDMFVLAVLAATIFGVYRWKKQPPADVEDRLTRRDLGALLVVLGLCYLSFPYQIRGPIIFFQIAQRIPAMAAVLLLMLPAGRLLGRERLVMVPLIAACVLLPIKLTTLYASFSRRNAGFMSLVDRLPLGAPTLVVDSGMMNVKGPVAEVSGDPATSAPVYWHFSSWPMALRGGFDPYIFDQGIPIRFRPEAKLAAPGWGSTSLFNVDEAPRFSYYLVKNPLPDLDHNRALEVAGRAGPWVLYHRIPGLSQDP